MPNLIDVENAALTPTLVVEEETTELRLVVENAELCAILDLGPARRNLGPIWFVDEDGDWVATDVALEAAGRPRGGVALDFDGQPIVDTEKMPLRTVLHSQWDRITHDVIVTEA